MERNEAIESLRKLYSETNAENKAALECLFPELRESEDERIRKFLVKHVSEWIGCIEHDLKLSSKDVESEEELAMFKAGLAYLDKQKERKMPDSTELIEMWEQEKAMLKEKDFRDDAWRLAYNAFLVGFARGCKVKQKEQKPAEWSEEDEKKREFLIKGLEDRMGFGWASDPFSREDLISFLENLRPSWKPSEQ